MVGSVIFISVIFFSNQIILAGENSYGNDSLFDNAIRSMTAPKPPLKPSGDPRFQNNQDGTITDLEHGLMWKQQDSYQEKKNGLIGKLLIVIFKKLIKKNLLVTNNWRLPTRKELLTLYEEDKTIPWFYYWQKNEVHLDPIFGYTSCCFWTSEEHKKIYAWHVNFIRGKAYPSIKKGMKDMAAGSASLSVVRPVRDMERAKKLQGLSNKALNNLSKDF